MPLLTGECEDDSDCGGSSQGSCIDLDAVSFPSKMCFCSPGWHGDNCAICKLWSNSNVMFDVLKSMLQ